MFKLVDLCREYKASSYVKVQALCGVNLQFPEKGLVVIVGKSGCGKTTLLSLLGGLDKPTSGSIFFNGSELGKFKAKEFDEFRNFHASFIFQDYNLLNDYSVIDNIKLAVNFQESSKEIVEQKAGDALEKVGLGGLENRRISQLSGGQKQRVAIARALAKDSSVVLCDEPTGNLDSSTANQIIELLKEVSKERLVIIVTHDDDICAFADRVVRLKDGMVAEDIEKTAPTLPVKAKNLPRKYSGLTFKHSLAMILNNIRHSIFTSSFITLLLASAFSLLIVFLSLTQFNPQASYVHTLKQNGQYVLQITKYTDSPIEIPNPANPNELITINWVQLFYEGGELEDIAWLKSENPAANFYPSYFFYKSFQDFTDDFIFFPVYKQKHFETVGFRELIVVDDFRTFHQELTYGDYPKTGNEILIYDYMAYCLIYHGLFEGQIADVVGKTLTDQQTGLSVKISGILKSDYENYRYITEKYLGDNTRFEDACLASFQAAFCKPELIDQIKNESLYSSVFEARFWEINTYYDEASIAITDIKKIKHTQLEGIDFMATVEDIENRRGFILSKKQVAAVLHIDEALVAKDVASDFVDNYQMNYYQAFPDYIFDGTMYSANGWQVIGVAEELDEEQGVVAYYDFDWEYATRFYNSALRQIYLSLTTDWALNSRIMDNFIVQTHPDEFYEQNQDYYYEGYTDFNGYGVLIYNASVYLEKTKNFADNIMVILTCASGLGIVLFSYLMVRKYGYKIGVLKSLGAKNSDIVLVFGLQLVVMAIIAFIIAIPASFILMNSINGTFVNTINSSLVVFFVHTRSLVYVFGVALAAVIVSSLIPLLKLNFSAPMDVIRGHS